jgi:hypothetical protein
LSLDLDKTKGQSAWRNFRVKQKALAEAGTSSSTAQRGVLLRPLRVGKRQQPAHP